MIDLSINLLSSTKKNKLKSLIKFLFVKEYLELVLLAACLLAIFDLAAFTIMTQVVNDLSNSSLLVTKDFSSLNREIASINKLLKSVSVSGSQFVPVTPWFAELVGILPADIRLTNFSIDRMAGTVSFSGLAATRETLVEFQKLLAALPWIKDVNVPHSQLLQKENVTFEITATLKEGVIKEKKATSIPASTE